MVYGDLAHGLVLPDGGGDSSLLEAPGASQGLLVGDGWAMPRSILNIWSQKYTVSYMVRMWLRRAPFALR